jgi:nucleoid-associated protein YgaU
MHRDVKLGLALGILIIGFAAAFCFPRLPAQEVVQLGPAVAPRLAVVDNQIRQLRVRSFVEDELAAAPTFESTNEIEAERAAASQLKSLLLNSPAPEPIPASVIAQALQPTPSSAISANTQPDALPNAPAAMLSDSPTSAGPATYTVQIGDTLSGIASKVMGSSRKYGELYAANTDIMANPDALVPGMVLKIPGGASSSTPSEMIAEEPPPPYSRPVLR